MNDIPLTSFTDAARVVEVAPGAFTADVPPDWAQGRTAFGGLAAGILINAVQALPGLADLPVRAVDAAFIGPVPPGPVRVRAEMLRQGKYLTHAAAELTAGAGSHPLARVHTVLGHLRASAVTVPPEPPDPVPLEQCLEMPYIPGMTPEFTRNLDFRFASGIPFTGSDSARVTGHCRHRSPEAGVAAISALVDAWPGTVLPLMTSPAPASTVRWSLQFPGDEPLKGDDWFWYTSDTPVATGGYSTMTAQLWREERLISWSEQLLAVFDRRS